MNGQATCQICVVRSRRVRLDAMMLKRANASRLSGEWKDEGRASATPLGVALTMLAVSASFEINLRALAPQLRCPTILYHARGDGVAPLDEGRSLAAPPATLVMLVELVDRPD
jgi:pimeloyl-ACP methyl ester carboxylesterase